MNYKTYLYENIFFSMNSLFFLEYSIITYYDEMGYQQENKVLLGETHTKPLSEMYSPRWTIAREEP